MAYRTRRDVLEAKLAEPVEDAVPRVVGPGSGRSFQMLDALVALLEDRDAMRRWVREFVDRILVGPDGAVRVTWL